MGYTKWSIKKNIVHMEVIIRNKEDEIALLQRRIEDNKKRIEDNKKRVAELKEQLKRV